ncbi:MAG: condensin complex protein MksE [Flavobacteriales bacterium]
MTMVFPKKHRQITDDLMSGKFVLSNNEIFNELKENADFYADFFKVSFDYELVLKSDYAYLLSKETNENFSRDVSIFVAVLSYELDRDGKNFMEAMEFSEFTFEEIDRYFENSSFIDLIESNKQLRDKESRRVLINAMARRNIVYKNFEDRFSFTQAYKMFIDFAKELAMKRMNNSEAVAN